MMSDPVELHLVSDSTGETAAKLSRAVEVQFPEQRFDVVRHPKVTSVDHVQLAAERARGRRAVLLYTLVKPEFRDAMRAACRRYKLVSCDLLARPLEAIARVSGSPAQMEADVRAPLDSTYFKRVAAMEFAVRFDDGVAAHGLRDADIVLVGVSRSSKTPLSIYLGYLGYKTANVPLVRGIEPPQELWDVEAAKIVGLTIDAEALLEIRTERARNIGARKRAYADLVEIYEELDYAQAIHRRLGCPVIEVSNVSIEETAHRIIRLVDERGAGRPAATA
ncbi:MAG: kinase/pyrophosphorylase [Actinobacteria bacterium]|nr:kinase/pyrophosphorylase [Actinomycetota bacterium]